MITAVVNTPIYIPFTLLDSLGAAETGKVNADFTNDIYLTSSPGTTATGTVSEVSEGRYLITFTPTAAGLWHVAWDVVVDGDTVEFEEIVNAQASTVVTVVSASAAGSLTQTLAQLRRRVARELGDYESLTSTSNGNVGKTTIIDADKINSATQDMKGRWVVSSSGTNNAEKRVVTAFDDSTNTITVNRAFTAQTATNDTFDVYNKRGKGFTPAEYDAAINDAINDSFPLHMIEQQETIGSVFDADGPGTFTVPASFVYVHTVEYQDEDSYWISLPQAARRNEYGWVADAAEGKIRILGRIGSGVDGQTIRVIGYGRQGTLSADSDTCTIPAEWIVYKACAALCLGALDKDSSYGPKVGIYEQRVNGLRTRIRTLRRTGSVRVRAA